MAHTRPRARRCQAPRCATTSPSNCPVSGSSTSSKCRTRKSASGSANESPASTRSSVSLGVRDDRTAVSQEGAARGQGRRSTGPGRCDHSALNEAHMARARYRIFDANTHIRLALLRKWSNLDTAFSRVVPLLACGGCLHPPFPVLPVPTVDVDCRSVASDSSRPPSTASGSPASCSPSSASPVAGATLPRSPATGRRNAY